MTLMRLIFRGLAFHARSHAGVALAAAVAPDSATAHETPASGRCEPGTAAKPLAGSGVTPCTRTLTAAGVL